MPSKEPHAHRIEKTAPAAKASGDRQLRPGTTRGHGLGRHTMPEMIEYSAVTAVHTIWLAARAEGIGMGWVSILDPAAVAATLDIPATWTFIGYLCLGFPETEDDIPDLERAGWERRYPASSRVVLRR